MQDFEDDIRARLAGHESLPNSDVWSRLNSRLDATGPKSTLRFRNYYRAVAASIALMVVSYASWQVFSPHTGKQQVSEKRPSEATSKPEEVLSNTEPLGSDHPKSTPQNAEPVTRAAVPLTNRASKVNDPVASIGDGKSNMIHYPNDHHRNQPTDIPFSMDGSVSHLDVPATAVRALEIPVGPRLPLRIPRDLLLAYRVADARARVRRSVRTKQDHSSWMAVGYSVGNYQQQVLAGSPDDGDTQSSAVYYGQNFGKLAIFTGLALTEQSYNNTSNLAYGNAAVRKAVAADNVNTSSVLSDFSVTSTYQANTQKRYVSVPIQAGWYVVDRRIKGMISAGLMSDYFLSSTVSDVSGVYQSSLIRRGAGSSYAGWVFSGIAGTEWSWGVAGRYQVALSPGFRYALTPVYRKDALSNGRSISADIGLRVRYFF